MCRQGQRRAWHAVTSLQEQLETPSGKGAADENFPVASRLIARPYRRHVHLFYAFARAADDIADNPELEAEDKIARLDLFAESLVNPRAASGAPSSALALARSLCETGVPARHPLAVRVGSRELFGHDASRAATAPIAAWPRSPRRRS